VLHGACVIAARYPGGPFAHGLMLHHFYGGVHPNGQGAIDAEQFDAMLDFMGAERFLPAEEWQRRSTAGTLKPDDLCVTFDDALRCQTDIALPVLQARGLTAFWFVYSSVFDGVPERLEIYRYLRTVCYPDIERFYDAFDAALNASAYANETSTALKDFVPENYLVSSAFYTRRDRIFRFLRDKVLGQEKYFSIMDAMVARSDLDVPALSRLLWMQNTDLEQLAAQGHIVGLHSFSHPTVMANETAGRQLEEYGRNSEHIARVTGQKPRSISYPCSSYNEDTFSVMRALGVELGFRANMLKGAAGPLERPRADHADILTMMKTAS
jgi:peptidoglycan/xylan/chitin deacetylase (PgdA/CDA1 family)